MVTITLRQKNHERTLTVPAGTTLLAALQQIDAAFFAPCGGGHTCGKCFVRATGVLSPVSENESALLAGRGPGVRLACFACALGDCVVDWEQTAAQHALTDLGGAARTGRARFAPEKYGFAVDIGTTTIAAYLYGADSAQPLAVLGEYNRQQQFGADVMARIAHVNAHTVEPLRKTITQQLASLFTRLCQAAAVRPDHVTDAVLTGNTVMLHLLAGLEVRSLALYPFTPVTLFGDVCPVDIPDFPRLRCYLPRCISAYVGADITCGMLAADLPNLPGTVLFADIGTNGEMALKTGDALLCCSTAAGPAFEGAGISCGCGAIAGAIHAVGAADGALQYDTLEQAPAVGLCGSGVIDAVAAFLQLGLLSARGKVDKSLGGVLPFPGTAVSLSQMDVRQLQLAKGAIRAGMDCMMQAAGLGYDALDQLLLCGGFGSYIRPESAEALGMLPPGSAAKTRAIGNAAGRGAAMLLRDEGAARWLDAIADRTRCMELSGDPAFAKLFVGCMNFPQR